MDGTPGEEPRGGKLQSFSERRGHNSQLTLPVSFSQVVDVTCANVQCTCTSWSKITTSPTCGLAEAVWSSVLPVNQGNDAILPNLALH